MVIVTKFSHLKQRRRGHAVFKERLSTGGLSGWCSFVIILFSFAGNIQSAAADLVLNSDWVKSAILAPDAAFAINGTGDRNNPIRRQLARSFDGDQLFVRYQLRYAGESIDQPDGGDGEFFVLWLDQTEGTDRATHSGGVPNIGIHVANGKNSFMARLTAGAEKHTQVELKGDRDYTLIGRLRKTKAGPAEPFDALELWINPNAGDELKPHVAVSDRRGIREVRWIGFSTGRKTEPTDRILVSGVRLADSWRGILGLPESFPVPPSPPEPAPAPKTVSFREHIYPILKANCFECHAGDKPKSKVRLDIADEMLNRIQPGKPDVSELIRRVTSKNPDERMPPPKQGEALPDDAINRLRAWIAEGLEWDEQLLPTPRPKTDHWAFQVVSKPPVPRVKNQDWVRSPVDAFIARRLEALGLNPAPVADDPTLRRRLALDLTGLPPDARLREVALDSFIEQLLASRQYGERWARHWLDVSRWAESNGHQHNRDRPYAWRYRDYVINSFSQDKPFDQFIREQIAGDELPFAEDHIVATGFLAAARYSGNELDKEIQRNDILTDIVNTTAKAFLGLTFECAQCHSHKFDPISIRDYYRMQAFFVQGQPGNVVLARDDVRARQLIEQRWRLFDSVHSRLVENKRRQGYPEPVLVIPKSVVSGMTAGERKTFDMLEAEIARLPQSWSFYSSATAANSLDVAPHTMRWPLSRDPMTLANLRASLLIRGDARNKGPEVSPGWAAVFGPTDAIEKLPRTALANWLGSKDNPLTARVWVNRIWQGHFGRGLVETSGDFGVKGGRPSHPELLDWLAGELMENGWSTRRIHRLILNSNTYRQASEYSAGNSEIDPDNRAYWRWQPRRLEAESIRDSVLAISGGIDLQPGGPSVPLAQAETSNRRSIYLQQKRDNLPHQQMLFDADNAVNSCSRRRVSTVALQPLYLLNSGFMQRMARSFAARLEPAKETNAKVARAIELALNRKPTADEVLKGVGFVASDGLESFCLALLNLNEFVYVP